MSKNPMKTFSTSKNFAQRPEDCVESHIRETSATKIGCVPERLDGVISQVIADSPVIIFAVDANGIINLCAGRAAELTGLNSTDLIGQSVYDIHDDISNAETFFPRLFSEDTGINSINFRGSQFDVWHTPLYDQKNKMIGVAGVAFDVSQRCQAEEKLREERRLLERMLRFHEHDRQLIAFEIHDGFIQNATAAGMLLSSMQKSLATSDGELCRQIQEADGLVQKAIDESRRLIRGLRPPVLEKMGVVAAITHLIEELQSKELSIQFKTEVEFNRLDPLLEATIYRITQQAVNNIQRHSRADRAEIRLLRLGESVHLEIQDWGVGFDPSSVSEDRFGLQGIRQRARLMRGRAHIDSALGKGTRIIVDLPLANPLEDM
jgi:PAS domain S-box-containing protein